GGAARVRSAASPRLVGAPAAAGATAKTFGAAEGFGASRRNPVTSDAGESLRTGEKSGGRHRAYRGSSSRPSRRTIAARSVSLRIGRPAAWRTLFTAGNT